MSSVVSSDDKVTMHCNDFRENVTTKNNVPRSNSKWSALAEKNLAPTLYPPYWS